MFKFFSFLNRGPAVKPFTEAMRDELLPFVRLVGEDVGMFARQLNKICHTVTQTSKVVNRRPYIQKIKRPVRRKLRNPSHHTAGTHVKRRLSAREMYETVRESRTAARGLML